MLATEQDPAFQGCETQIKVNCNTWNLWRKRSSWSGLLNILPELLLESAALLQNFEFLAIRLDVFLPHICFETLNVCWDYKHDLFKHMLNIPYLNISQTATVLTTFLLFVPGLNNKELELGALIWPVNTINSHGSCISFPQCNSKHKYNFNIIITLSGLFNRSISILFYWFKSTLLNVCKALDHARHDVNARDF